MLLLMIVALVAITTWWWATRRRTSTKSPVVKAPPGFSISPMKPDEYDSCMNMCVDVFRHHNPAVRHMGITADAYGQLCRADCPQTHSVDSGLSLVCRSTDGTIAGFLFCNALDLRHTDIAPTIFDLHPGNQVGGPATFQPLSNHVPATFQPLSLYHVTFRP